MEKPIVNMTNWAPYVYKNSYSLSGVADNHPTLGKNSYVYQTSSLLGYHLTEEELTYETRNTIYKCQLKYLTLYPYRNVIGSHKLELSRLDETSQDPLDHLIATMAKLALELDGTEEFPEDTMLQRIKALQKQGQMELKEKEERENSQLVEIAKNYEDCVYLEVSNVPQGSKLAYHLGDDCGVVEPQLHSGMFQDSILYMKYRHSEEDTALDFRYFPKGIDDILETYSWSDNIMQAVIKNNTSYSIRFNGTEIPVGETKVFTPEGHRQGLFSPDCYNGKSAFFMPSKASKDSSDDSDQ